MSTRGSYNGGSTIVYPSSDWFGHGEGVKPWVRPSPDKKKGKPQLSVKERKKLAANLKSRRPENIEERRSQRLEKNATKPDYEEKSAQVAKKLSSRMKNVLVVTKKPSKLYNKPPQATRED